MKFKLHMSNLSLPLLPFALLASLTLAGCSSDSDVTRQVVVPSVDSTTVIEPNPYPNCSPDGCPEIAPAVTEPKSAEPAKEAASVETPPSAALIKPAKSFPAKSRFSGIKGNSFRPDMTLVPARWIQVDTESVIQAEPPQVETSCVSEDSDAVGDAVREATLVVVTADVMTRIAAAIQTGKSGLVTELLRATLPIGSNLVGAAELKFEESAPNPDQSWSGWVKSSISSIYSKCVNQPKEVAVYCAKKAIHYGSAVVVSAEVFNAVASGDMTSLTVPAVMVGLTWATSGTSYAKWGQQLARQGYIYGRGLSILNYWFGGSTQLASLPVLVNSTKTAIPCSGNECALTALSSGPVENLGTCPNTSFDAPVTPSCVGNTCALVVRRSGHLVSPVDSPAPTAFNPKAVILSPEVAEQAGSEALADAELVSPEVCLPEEMPVDNTTLVTSPSDAFQKTHEAPKTKSIMADFAARWWNGIRQQLFLED